MNEDSTLVMINVTTITPSIKDAISNFVKNREKNVVLVYDINKRHRNRNVVDWWNSINVRKLEIDMARQKTTFEDVCDLFFQSSKMKHLKKIKSQADFF